MATQKKRVKKNNEISQWGMNSKNAECNLWKIAKFKSYIYIFCFYVSRSSFLSKAPESNFCMGESGIKYSDVWCYPLAIFEYFRRLKLLNMNVCSIFCCASFNLKKKMKENLYIKTSYIRETLIDFFLKILFITEMKVNDKWHNEKIKEYYNMLCMCFLCCIHTV